MRAGRAAEAARCLALLALACGEPEAPEPRLPREPAHITDDTSGEPECALGEVQRWMDAEGSLALAMPDDGLVLALHDGVLKAQRLSEGGRAEGRPETSRLPGADALLALEPRGERYLVLARGACGERADCLIAAALDADGSAHGQPISAPLPEPIRTARRAASEAFFFAWSTLGGHRALERFEVEGDALRHQRIALGDAPASAERPVEILGLAADGDAFAALWRRGATEDVESEVFLTGPSSHREVHALHHALAIDAIELHGDALALIATFEFSRPHLLRMRLTAGEPTDARELAHGAAAPAPFADRRRAALDVDARGLWLRRRDAAGDPLGEAVRITDATIESAALTRRGEAFFVAWLDGGVVRGRRVRCR